MLVVLGRLGSGCSTLLKALAGQTYISATLGLFCSERVTTAHLLASLTNTAERVIHEGYETRVPCHPDKSADVWKRIQSEPRF